MVQLFLENNEQERAAYTEKFNFLDSSKQLILVIRHLRASFGKGFDSICEVLKKLSIRKDVQVVYFVRFNPNVQEPVRRILGSQSGIYLIVPLDDLPFAYLMR
jgi:UDP-N-acetylglucosamine 2-epimerase (non-hydrolysing)